MTINKSKKIVVFKNTKGEALRVVQTQSDELKLVQNKFSKRIEIVDSNFDFKKSHTLIQPISLSNKEYISLKSIGSLSIQSGHEHSQLDHTNSISNDIPFALTFKWSSISHGIVLSILILFYLFIPSKKLVKNVPSADTLVTIRVEKPETTPEPQIAQLLPTEVKKNITTKKSIQKLTVTPRINKRNSLKVTHSGKSKTHFKQQTQSPKSAKTFKSTNSTFQQLGSLATLNNALKGTRYGNGSGLRLNGQESGNGGFGRGAGAKRGHGTMGNGNDSGGGYEQALYGKGLIAGQVGGGQGGLGSGWGIGRKGSGSFGTKGKGGGHAGYGTSRFVSGSKTFSYPVNEDAMIEGGLDREAVIQVVMKNIGQITYCYELGLQKKPELRGRVLVDFIINGSGKVSSNSISTSTLKSEQVENCMLSKIRNWKFPRPVGGVNVEVNYPFALQRVSEVSQNLTAK